MTNQRAYYLQLMREALDRAIAATGDVKEQRLSLERINFFAHFASEPPLEWIIAELAKPGAPTNSAPSPPAAPAQSAYTCRGCGKEFATATALNGHGPARCEKGGKT